MTIGERIIGLSLVLMLPGLLTYLPSWRGKGLPSPLERSSEAERAAMEGMGALHSERRHYRELLAMCGALVAGLVVVGFGLAA